jgi:DNA-directed RNA polymerase subunit RPC12/RpoP
MKWLRKFKRLFKRDIFHIYPLKNRSPSMLDSFPVNMIFSSAALIIRCYSCKGKVAVNMLWLGDELKLYGEILCPRCGKDLVEPVWRLTDEVAQKD